MVRYVSLKWPRLSNHLYVQLLGSERSLVDRGFWHPIEASYRLSPPQVLRVMHRNPLEHQTGLPVGRFSFFLYRGALVAWSNVSIHLLAAGTYRLVLNWLGNLSDSELKIAIGGLFLGF